MPEQTTLQSEAMTTTPQALPDLPGVLLEEAARHLREHNSEYQHRTPADFIGRLEAAALRLRSGQQIPTPPAGYKLVPITHTVNVDAWDRMTLAIRPAMTHPGFNEPSDVAAGKAWDGNSSHLVRSIIAACPDFAPAASPPSPAVPAMPSDTTRLAWLHESCKELGSYLEGDEIGAAGRHVVLSFIDTTGATETLEDLRFAIDKAIGAATPAPAPVVQPITSMVWPPDVPMLQVAVAPNAAAGPYPTAMRPATAEEAARYAVHAATPPAEAPAPLPPKSESFWVIERGSPAEYWVNGDGEVEGWTSNIFQAQHFNEWGAKTHMAELLGHRFGVKGPLRAREHIRSDEPPAPLPLGDEALLRQALAIFEGFDKTAANYENFCAVRAALRSRLAGAPAAVQGGQQ